MTSTEIALQISSILDDKKGQNIKVLKIDEISSLGDYFVLATGSSSTQVQALSDAVETLLKEKFGIAPSSIEGNRLGGWILLDYLDVIVHIFTTEARDYYDLDRLWVDAKEIKVEE